MVQYIIIEGSLEPLSNTLYIDDIPIIFKDNLPEGIHI